MTQKQQQKGLAIAMEQLKEMPHRQKSDNAIIVYLINIWEKLSKYFQKEL